MYKNYNEKKNYYEFPATSITNSITLWVEVMGVYY